MTTAKMIRGAGLIAAVESRGRQGDAAAPRRRRQAQHRDFARAHEHGFIVRAIGDTTALCPPLIITADQVEDMVVRLAATLADVCPLSG